jgi:hypothetical protein
MRIHLPNQGFENTFAGCEMGGQKTLNAIYQILEEFLDNEESFGILGIVIRDAWNTCFDCRRIWKRGEVEQSMSAVLRSLDTCQHLYIT